MCQLLKYSLAKTQQAVGPNSNANIDTKNILQYRVHEKYSMTNYIKTCHSFRSYFPQNTGNILCSFKGNSKTSNKKKKPNVVDLQCWESRISRENGMPVRNIN